MLREAAPSKLADAWSKEYEYIANKTTMYERRHYPLGPLKCYFSIKKDLEEGCQIIQTFVDTLWQQWYNCYRLQVKKIRNFTTLEGWAWNN